MMNRVLYTVSSHYCGSNKIKIDRNIWGGHKIVYSGIALSHKWKVGKSLPGKAEGVPGWSTVCFYVMVFV